MPGLDSLPNNSRRINEHIMKGFKAIVYWFVLGNLFLIYSCKDSPRPLLTAIDGPTEFVVGDLDQLYLFLSVDGKNISLGEGLPIEFQVAQEEGKKIPVEFTNNLTSDHIYYDNAEVGIIFTEPDSSLYDGNLKICASSEGMKGNPCITVSLSFYSPFRGLLNVQDNIRRLKKLIPAIACKCKSGTIRRLEGDKSHGGLGTFTTLLGGDKYGTYHIGDVNTDGMTSVFKFEPHFEIEIIGLPPNKPEHIPQAEYNELLKILPYLCKEGQRINGTFVRTKSSGDIEKIPYENELGEKFSYKVSKAKKDFTLDRHGYQATIGELRKEQISGNIKVHDNRIIHWLDAPGFVNVPAGQKKGREPKYADMYFHAFVHGSTGKTEDNCNCYMGVRSFVVDKKGNAGPTKIISPLVVD